MRKQFFYVVLLLSVLAGCGGSDDGLTRVVVTGTAKYQGKPVVDGQIRFNPVAGTSAPVAFERITNGSYKCDYHGGLPIGTYRIAIYSWDPNVPPPTAPFGPARTQFIPPKYNEHSELVWTLDKQAQPVVKDFNLE